MEKAVAPLVGYVRVSAVRGRGDERFKSPDLQREAMTRWADNRFGRNGYEWLDWFTDLDRSGVSLDRPELNKARLCAIETDVPHFSMTFWPPTFLGGGHRRLRCGAVVVVA